MKLAIITIEVIISFIILLLVIVLSTMSNKHITLVTQHKNNYEKKFIDVMNIRAKLATDICKTLFTKSESLESVSYTATCHKLKELRNFTRDSEAGISGLIGNKIIQFYQVQLVVKDGEREYEQSYYITRIKSALR